MTTDNKNGLKTLHFNSGETIFKEGQAGKSFYIIQKGNVEISTTEEDEKIVIATASTGDSVGEFAFITKRPRSATVTAIDEVTVTEVSSETYQKLFDDIPFWAQTMIQELVSKLASSTDLIKKNQLQNKELITAIDEILE